MNAAVDALAREFTRLGYATNAVVRNYTFADFVSEGVNDRTVALAAFTQTPTSYRNAAAGVVVGGTDDPADLARHHLSLGAPLLFVIEQDSITAWQVRTDMPPRQISRVSPSEVATLFDRHSKEWAPAAIHRAKSIGSVDPAYQLDFVDLGLVPLIEGRVHSKLDQLLTRVLKVLHFRGVRSERLLFRTVFRLLAAKILRDREHSLARSWNEGDARDVLKTITEYYGLADPAQDGIVFSKSGISAAWDELRNSLNFRNISADDLAYVYENTLVTPEVRRTLGTHSTPRQVAEYVVSRLELWRHDPNNLNVYEPFVGAGVFLVSALRHVRDLLPGDWSDRRRHNFLVQHLRGDDVDSFAVEVSKLSLILADYPNANGWRIDETNLFVPNVLRERMSPANVILCNPPFEQFEGAERSRYAIAAGSGTYTKASAVLKAALDAKPKALGFVLPEPFLLGDQYAPERQQIEREFKSIELVRLPDRLFAASVVRSALLIASGKRGDDTVTVRSSVVRDHDRAKFLESGYVSSTLTQERTRSTGRGDLWVNELDELWRYLRTYQPLGTHIEAHRGLEWSYRQRDAVSSRRQPGFERGIFSARSIRQFLARPTDWLDVRPESAKYEAYKLPWAEPKVLINAARLSRGPWCAAAAVDSSGLVASQQLFGIWPRPGRVADLEITAAIINSPLGNAYLDTHSLPDRIRKTTLEQLPMPRSIPDGLHGTIRAYEAALMALEPMSDSSQAESLLRDIDTLIVTAYDLPPRLERQLLEYFRGSVRPVAHEWHHWLPMNLKAAVPLSELMSADFAKVTGDWLLRVLKPLSPIEIGSYEEVAD